jgi:hypothetical protein
MSGAGESRDDLLEAFGLGGFEEVDFADDTVLVHPEPLVTDEDDGMVERVFVNKVKGPAKDFGEFEGSMDPWMLLLLLWS